MNNCLPNCTNNAPGDKVPDPQDCRKFYTCLATDGPSDVSFFCSEGERFDSVSRECLAEGAVCGLCMLKCKYDCVIAEDYAAVRGDCGKMTLCELNPPLTIDCGPATPYFDGESCQDDHSKCCEDCIVFCQEPNIETADPTSSLRSYHACSFYYYYIYHDPSNDNNYRVIDSLTSCIDLTTSACVRVRGATCESTSCIPSCVNATTGEQIPDPKDCYRYYTCLATGRPTDVSFLCPNEAKIRSQTEEMRQ
ncbi:hypothetical protein O3P69_019308 [Scylla paramamosain]|uniref:Chitin-binding type-2 domain-containing protein n=1 Tax=Scylla paramamosain TaxID=85552 RepID=A0AAW0SXA9_SCYPA